MGNQQVSSKSSSKLQTQDQQDENTNNVDIDKNDGIADNDNSSLRKNHEYTVSNFKNKQKEIFEHSEENEKQISTLPKQRKKPSMYIQQEFRRIFFIYNPFSGGAEKKENILKYLSQYFGNKKMYEVFFYQINKTDNFTMVVQEAVENNCDWIFIAGGDGSITQLIWALYAIDALYVPVGIIPMGTGNALAKELGLPLHPKRALKLLGSKKTRLNILPLDAIKVKDKLFLLHIEVGLGAKAVQAADPQQKRRYGVAAYLYEVVKHAKHHKPFKFILTVDGVNYRTKATEVIIANAGGIGVHSKIKWRKDIYIDSGRLDICIIKAQSTSDYWSVVWSIVTRNTTHNANIKWLEAKRCVRVEVEGNEQLPLEADGEVIGHTPFTAELIPSALQVLTIKN